MIRVPLTNNVRPAGQTAPRIGLNEGTQGLAALGNLGRTIGQVGDQLFDAQVKMQRIENERMVNERKAGLRKTIADFQNEIINDHNPETWPARFSQKVDGYLSKAGIEGLPPEAREQFQAWAGDFRGGQELSLARDAAVKVVRRNQERTANTIQSAMDGNDFDAAEDYVRGSSIYSPEEQTRIIHDIGQKRETYRLQKVEQAYENMVAADPFGVGEKLDDETKFPELDPTARERLKYQATKYRNRRAGDAIDDAHNGMADGTVTRPEQIEELYPDLPARLKETLKLDLSQRSASMDDAYRKSPEFQERAVGEITGLLDGLEGADGEDFQKRYATASYALTQLPDSPAKRMLADDLEAAKDGRQSAVDTSEKAMQAALKDAIPRMFPDIEAEPVKREMSIQKAVSDGILKDERKLGPLLSPEARELLAKAQDGDKPLSDSQMAELFREEFGKRTPEEQARGLAILSPLDRAVFEGIRDRKGFSSKVSVVSPEAEDAAISRRMEAQERLGRVRMKLAEWAASPEGIKATPKERDDKLFEISGGEVRRGSASKFFDDAPSSGGKRAGGFIPGETSMNLPENLTPHRATFVREGLAHGIDPRFLVAISKLETANGKSSAFRNKNNAMGVSNSSGPISFENVDASIARMARVLASPNGPYKNARTIPEIAAIYAPPGAGNDPNGTNGYWATGVSKFYKELGGNPAAIIK